MLLGKKSAVLRGLQKIEFQMASHRPLELLLPDLGRNLACPEAAFCFQILPLLRQAGGNVQSFIKKQLQMISESLSLQKDLGSETSQRQTEALIMSFIPFAMAAFLRKSSNLYADDFLSSQTGITGMLTAYAIAVVAVVLTLSSLGIKDVKIKNQNYEQSTLGIISWPPAKRVGALLQKLYLNLLPETYSTRLLQQLALHAEFTGQQRVAVFTSFFIAKAGFLTAGMLPAVALTAINRTNIYWMIFLPAGLCLLQDMQCFNLAVRQIEEDQLDFPNFLNLASSLLQSGLSLHICLEICVKSQTGHETSLNYRHGLNELGRKMHGGMPAGRALEEMAARCLIPQIQSALLMMVRYDRDGSFENLHILQLQTATCWSLHCIAARKRLERKSLRLLLPMALDLVSVMLTAILPAIQTLKAI